MDEFLTAIAIVAATVTWIITHWYDRASDRVTHTTAVLASLSTSDRLAESSFQVTRLIDAGRKVSRRSGIDEKLEGHVVDILDYYEFICDLYISGVLSRKTIVELRGRLMRRTWSVREEYIMETRAAQKRPVYSGFERFVRELPFND